MKLKRLFLIPAFCSVVCSYAFAEEPVKPEALPEGQHMYVI